jgi:hypothetical protein
MELRRKKFLDGDQFSTKIAPIMKDQGFTTIGDVATELHSKFPSRNDVPILKCSLISLETYTNSLPLPLFSRAP